MRLEWFFPALMLLLCWTLISCGKKGDPFLPAPEANARVSDLQGEWNGESVLLSGRSDEAVEEGATIRAYYAAYPLDEPPCEGCPIQYQGFQSFGLEVMSGGGFSCRITEIRPGNVYFFQVRILSPGGSLGPPSHRVRVEVP